MIKAHLIKIFSSKNVIDDPETLEHYSENHNLVPDRKPMYFVVAETHLQTQKLL
jgi:hypothetical protein